MFRDTTFENLFIQDVFYYIDQIFCIWLHKTDFIISIVAQVCNMTHGPLDK